LTVSSTLEKLSKYYTCFILRRFGLFLIHLQSKNKAKLGNVSNSKPYGSMAQETTVLWRKRRETQKQSRQPCHSRWLTSHVNHRKLLIKETLLIQKQQPEINVGNFFTFLYFFNT